jgi:hypothetical protein
VRVAAAALRAGPLDDVVGRARVAHGEGELIP